MTALEWLCRVYRLLLGAYPAEFRDRYADEMARVFRDRGREIEQAHGAWGLLRYTLSTGEDWFVTVLKERMDSMRMPFSSIFRCVFLFSVVLDFVLLTRQRTSAFHPTPEAFFLLVMYGLLGLLAATNLDTRREWALRTGTLMGLISGAILTIWAVGGYYFLPTAGIVPQLMGLTSMAIIFGCWSVAGYRAGWKAGCWSGIVCVLVKVTCAFVLASTPLPGEQFRHILSGAVQHLLEGPVIGAILGAIGGLTARVLSKPQPSPATLGLAGGK